MNEVARSSLAVCFAMIAVPTQALFFLNGELSAQAADALASRVLSAGANDRARTLVEIAFGRLPSEHEVARINAGAAELEMEFASEPETEKRLRKAWATVCQSVLASNEFIHTP